MSVRRVCALVLGAGLGCGLLAAPAWAHVKVDAHPERPGAANAQLTFSAKSESKTAGITKLEILASPAIPGSQVILAGGPAGWKVGPGEFGGFKVEGAALPAGHDARVTVEVKQLPKASQIVFKVLQSYSDGRIDRWTDLPGSDGKEPEHPASILKLSAGAPGTAVKGAREAKPADVKGARETKPAEGAQGALARTGSGSRLLALLAGLLFLAGGSSIVASAGRRSVAAPWAARESNPEPPG